MENLKKRFQELKGDLTEIIAQSKEVQEKLAVVQVESKKAQRVGQDIQRKVSEFQVISEPKLDKMNEIMEKYKTEEK